MCAQEVGNNVLHKFEQASPSSWHTNNGGAPVEWHDLANPTVLTSVDVVVHSAPTDELTFDDEMGMPTAYRGIPVTRCLSCPDCGSRIGWGLDAFSCPCCGGKRGGQFEPLRGQPRVRSRAEWQQQYALVRRELAIAPGRRKDVEGQAPDDVAYRYEGSSASEDDEDGTAKPERGSVQAPVSQPEDRFAPFPAVKEPCLAVDTLQSLANRLGDGPILEDLRSRLLEQTAFIQSLSSNQPNSRTKDHTEGYAIKGTTQVEAGYTNSQYLTRWAVEPLLSDEPFCAGREGLATLAPEIAMNLHEQSVPFEHSQSTALRQNDITAEFMRRQLQMLKLVCDADVQAGTATDSMAQRVCNRRSRMRPGPYPVIGQDGQPSIEMEAELRKHLKQAAGLRSEDGRQVTVDLRLGPDETCEPLSAITFSCTVKGKAVRCTGIARDQHTCIRSHARITAAARGEGLSKHGSGPYHLLLTKWLADLQDNCLWPLPTAVLRWLADQQGMQPYFIQRRSIAACRRLVDNMTANKLKYQATVILKEANGREYGDESDDDGHDRVELPVLAEVGVTADEDALVLFSMEDWGMADEVGLSVMYRTAAMVGVDVCRGELGRDFDHLACNKLRAASLPTVEPRCLFHRERAVYAAYEHPQPQMNLDDINDGDDLQEAQHASHARAVLRSVLSVAHLRSSIGRSALKMPHIDLQPAVTAANRHLFEAGDVNQSSIGQDLLSGDALAVRRAFLQLKAVSARRQARAHSSLVINRMNSSELCKQANQTVERTMTAPMSPAPRNAQELMTWACTQGNLPSIGNLTICRAIGSALGAEGTLLAEPFDDAKCPIGYGNGTVQGQQKALRAGRKAGKLAADSKVSVHGTIRATQRWFGGDGQWFVRGTDVGGCMPRCRHALQLVDAAKRKLWFRVTLAAVRTWWPAYAAENPWCDIAHRLVEPTTVPKPFSLIRYHALPPWVIQQASKQPDGKLLPTLLDLRTVLVAEGATIPTDDERHALSVWRNAPYDAPTAGIIMPVNNEVPALRQFVSGASDIPQAQLPTSKDRLRKLAVETASRRFTSIDGIETGSVTAEKCGLGSSSSSTLTSTAPRPPASQVVPHKSAAAKVNEGAKSLHQHNDLYDDQLGATAVMSLTNEHADGIRLYVDIPIALTAHLTAKAAQLPTNAVTVIASGPRQPEARVVSAATLRRLPTRHSQASFGPGLLVRFCAYIMTHFVSAMEERKDIS